jgi:hypothetical protein
LIVTLPDPVLAGANVRWQTLQSNPPSTEAPVRLIGAPALKAKITTGTAMIVSAWAARFAWRFIVIFSSVKTRLTAGTTTYHN